MKKAVLGIDIGGTKVKLAPVYGGGQIGSSASFQVPAGVKPGQLARLVGEQAAALGAAAKTRFTAAGAGCPGHVSVDRRTLIYAPNLRWRNSRFAQLLENRLSVPVVLENDVNAAALGEQRFGAGKGAQNVICLFVGTGVGGGVIAQGELLRGATGNAAEVGHTVFRPGGRTCSCGRKGCVEAYAGGAHMPEHYRELGGKKGLNAAAIWDLADAGDSRAARVRKDAVEALVTLTVSLHTVMDADRIVLGGGVIRHIPGLHAAVKEGVLAYIVGPWKSKVRIVKSKLWANAGILGAASLAAGLF